MNILTELLPGARQLRTPLAIGYLWILVIWVNFPHFPGHLRHSLLAARVTHDAKNLTPVLLLVLVSFAAYLLGLLMQIMHDVIATLAAVAALAIFLFAVAAFPIGLAFALWPFTLGLFAAIIIYLIWHKWRYGRAIGPKVLDSVVFNQSLGLDQYYKIEKIFRRIWLTASLARDKLVSERLAELLDSNPVKRTEFADTLSSVYLLIACRTAGLNDEVATLTAPDGKIVSVKSATRHIISDKNNELVLRLYLAQRLESSVNISAKVLMQAINSSDARNTIEKGLDNARVLLRADKPSVFEGYDRLLSEAEFRKGVAVPIAVVLSSICAFFTKDIASIVALAIPGALLYFSGLVKDQEASAIITSCVDAGVVSVDLEVSDVRALAWPTGERKTRSKNKKNRLSRKLDYLRPPGRNLKL